MYASSEIKLINNAIVTVTISPHSIHPSIHFRNGCFHCIAMLFHFPMDCVEQEHWCSSNRMDTTLMGVKAKRTNKKSKQKSIVEGGSVNIYLKWNIQMEIRYRISTYRTIECLKRIRIFAHSTYFSEIPVVDVWTAILFDMIIITFCIIVVDGSMSFAIFFEWRTPINSWFVDNLNNKLHGSNSFMSTFLARPI